MNLQATNPTQVFESKSKDTISATIYRNEKGNNEAIPEKREVQLGYGPDLNYLAEIPHSEIFDKLLNKVEKQNLKELLSLQDDEKPNKTQLRIKIIEYTLKLAKEHNWNICRKHDFIYLYNNSFWALVEGSELQLFLGSVAEHIGVKWEYSQDYKFREELVRQFMAVAHLPTPPIKADQTMINFKNGTLDISMVGQVLRKPDYRDFIRYELPYPYDPSAKAPLFFQYLNFVLPDQKCQSILAEYLAYVFINNSILKLEKCLLLYGTGANGKSVFFEITNALLGEENVSNFSLQCLTDISGYFRAKIANKLVNYASEINGKLEADVFKRLASGEPVEARLPYGEPFTLTNYARLIFNVNELPKDVEHTHAYFRRFLIIPFEIQIPEHLQDKELSKKIINHELSGVFNWVMDGLKRLLAQKKFTESDKVQKEISEYKRQSDSVQMFLEEQGYQKSPTDCLQLSAFYREYRDYSISSGFHPCSLKTIGGRLKNLGYSVERKSGGNMVFATKNVF